MENMSKKLGFIVGFLVLTMIIDASFGNKATSNFLLLVLASMLIINSSKIIKWVQTNFV